MRTSQRGIDLIKKYEGLRLNAYLCPAGVPTIGYGHTKGVAMGDTTTPDQAEQLLRQDLAKFEDGIVRLGLPLKQHQFDALVSFAFNLGLGALQKSTLLRKAKADINDPTIPDEFRKWTRAGGKVLDGLVRRRNEEAELWQSA